MAEIPPTIDLITDSPGPSTAEEHPLPPLTILPGHEEEGKKRLAEGLGNAIKKIRKTEQPSSVSQSTQEEEEEEGVEKKILNPLDASLKDSETANETVTDTVFQTKRALKRRIKKLDALDEKDLSVITVMDSEVQEILQRREKLVKNLVKRDKERQLAFKVLDRLVFK